MRKIKSLTLLALLAVSPLLLGAGLGGFPSQPKFKKTEVNSTGLALPACTTDPATCATFTVTAENSTNNAGTSARGMARFVNATTHANIIIDGNGVAAVRFAQLGGMRWNFKKNAAAEIGANAGSDFEIQSFDDTGVHLGYPFIITRSNNKVSIVGTLYSSKACAAGYTRKSPNYCGAGTGSSLLTTAGCYAVGSSASDAVSQDYVFDVQITSANAVAERSILAELHTNSSCTAIAETLAWRTYEFSAVADGTIIYRIVQRLKVDANARWIKFVSESGGTSTGVIAYSEGYGD